MVHIGAPDFCKLPYGNKWRFEAGSLVLSYLLLCRRNLELPKSYGGFTLVVLFSLPQDDHTVGRTIPVREVEMQRIEAS